jgi:hypothetical protein
MSLRRYKTPQRWRYKKEMSRDSTYWREHDKEFNSPIYDNMVKQVTELEDQRIINELNQIGENL